MNSTKKIIGLLFLSFILSNNSLQAQQEGFLGEVKMFAGNFVPRGWAFCDGQLLSIAQNQALFSVIGTIYGGDGRTTFALPDFRGRVAMSAGRHPGSNYTYVQGQRGGAEQRVLNILQLPTHNHIATTSGSGSNVALSTINAVREVPIAGDVPAVVNFPGSLGAQRVKAYGPPTNTVAGQAISGGNIIINNTGGSQPVDSRQPYTVVRYIICTQGVFPSRN